MAVMVPHLILICENTLMTEGFVTVKAVASKFFCLYSLLKALLSAQLHFDWGLRAISISLSSPEDSRVLMRALRHF
eukprot:scaffold7863_cov37-Cyclotella_meneghiniana.AAC.4